jgi:HAD superfamily hydrolase (TIGR01509 family)
MPVWNIVHALKAQGYTLHILSNIGHTIFEDLRKKQPEIFAAFDEFKVVTAQDGYVGKPRPAFFQHYLAAHNPTGKQVIFIDDKPKNTKAAAHHGMHAIFFCCAQHVQEKLNMLGLQ